jgi:hypothetical protein
MARKKLWPVSALVAGMTCTIVLGMWAEFVKYPSNESVLIWYPKSQPLPKGVKKQETVSDETSKFVDDRSWPKGTTREGRDSLWCSDYSSDDPRCLKMRKQEVIHEGWSPAFTRSEAADNPAWTGLQVPSEWKQYSVRLASDADLERMKKANMENDFESDWTQYPYAVGSYADGDGLFSNHENAEDKAMASPDANQVPEGAKRCTRSSARAWTT